MEWGEEPRWCLTAGTYSLCRIGMGSLMEQKRLELPQKETAGVRSESEDFRTCSWCESPLDGMSAALAAGVKARLTGCQLRDTHLLDRQV